MEKNQVILKGFGTADNIHVDPIRQLPELNPHEVLIRVEASTVSATDLLIRKGIYPLLKESPPFTLGYDFVGRVALTGSKVKRWKVGDRVADVCMTGGNADYIIRPEAGLLNVKEDLPAEKAVWLVMTGMTAYQIFKSLNLREGQSALIHGGAGAIGSTLLQLCKLNGIRAVSTGSASKLDFICYCPNGKQASFYGVMDSKKGHPEQYQSDFDELEQLVLEKKVNLDIHQLYPLKEVKKAHLNIESGEKIGFLAIKNQFTKPKYEQSRAVIHSNR